MLENLNLNRPLVFFDTETTGVNIAKDRIVELCAIKVYPDKTQDVFLQRFNPGIPIPPEATAIHGITDEMVANEPLFVEKAREIQDFFMGCDFAGYNLLKFDVPLSVEEFLRNGIKTLPFDGARFIDCLSIWYKKETRTLTDAVKYFTGGMHENAHSSLADVEATMSVLMGQLSKYADLEPDVEAIDTFIRQNAEILDYSGKFARDIEGDIIFTFGDNKGKKVKTNLGMVNWMLTRDFSGHTKYIAKQILDDELICKIL